MEGGETVHISVTTARVVNAGCFTSRTSTTPLQHAARLLSSTRVKHESRDIWDAKHEYFELTVSPDSSERPFGANGYNAGLQRRGR